MRSASSRRMIAALVVCAMSACGGSTPTAPDMPAVTIATGPQVLRITYQGQCNTPDGRFVPLIYSRVVVTRIGTEWVAAAASADAGDVELRFHLSGLAVISGSVPVAGTIRGTAVHASDLAPVLPPSTARVSFGADGRTAVSGFAFSPSSLTPFAGVSGIGSGTITMSDGSGQSCAGTAFSWSLASA